MTAGIWVVAEHRGGELKKSTFEALGLARRIAQERGYEVLALILADSTTAFIGRLGAAGADKILSCQDPCFANYSPEVYAATVGKLARERGPALILMGATAMGKDLAGRLAARLETALLADVIQLNPEGGTFVAKRPMNAGKVIATIEAQGAGTVIATIRPKAFDVPTLDDSRTALVEPVPLVAPTGGARAQVKAFNRATAAVELTEADVIVAAGRGIRGPENMRLVEELASAVHGAVGASRAVVDAGWCDHSIQVGQTGKVVAPKLYLAIGVSGAIQHLVGISNAKYVLAINKDAEAPIFKRADCGIVGDLFEIVPALTAALRGAG